VLLVTVASGGGNNDYEDNYDQSFCDCPLLLSMLSLTWFVIIGVLAMRLVVVCRLGMTPI
jgi:hypothetical protein